MKKVHIYIFAVLFCAALSVTGCSDRAVTLSEITGEEVQAEEGGEQVESELEASVVSESIAAGETSEAAGVPEEPDVILVYICGCVVNPGVYELPEGSRICDGLEAAGGFSEGADESRINLAGYLSDGDMVYFPEEGEEMPEGSAGATGASDAGAASGLININTASADTLQTLPGIGASKAAAIVKYREENGAFTDKSQIKNVSGIGENLYRNIEDLICV
jgi:competence protein ComEA